MIEDIIKIHGFNNASTVEIRRSNNPEPIAKEPEKKVDTEDANKQDNKSVKDAMDTILSVVRFFNRKIRLEVEDELNIMIVKVIDKETDKVIRQIPSKEIVELSKHAKDLKGLLINKEG